MSLESNYLWLEVRRTRFRRLITGSMTEFERTGMRSSILILLPIEGQKVEGVDPISFEEEIRDREQEPARTSNGATITTSWRHDLNTFLKQLKGLNGVDMRT